MANSNPAIKGKTDMVSDCALSTILCRDGAATDTAIANITANGVEAVADAISKGHSWSGIADYFGCTEAHLRSRWLAKLKPDEKELITWAERQYSERLIPHLLRRMQETVDESFELAEGVDPLEHRAKVAALKDAEVKPLERVLKAAQNHVLANVDKSKPELTEQRPPPQVNIIIAPDTAESMLKFAN